MKPVIYIDDHKRIRKTTNQAQGCPYFETIFSTVFHESCRFPKNKYLAIQLRQSAISFLWIFLLPASVCVKLVAYAPKMVYPWFWKF